MTTRTTPDPWPVLKSYSDDTLARIAMPLGGIGAGSVSIGGRGELLDWELFNRPSKGFIPSSVDASPSVMMHIQTDQNTPQLLMAEGRLQARDYSGCVGSIQPNHGIPRFRQCRFDAAYPLAQVYLDDPEINLSVQLQAFSPVIPGNPDDSSLPLLQLRYRLTNNSDATLSIATIATLPNFIGVDSTSREILGNGRFRFKGAKANRIAYRQGDDVQGLFYDSAGVNSEQENWGSLALCTDAGADVSYRTCWLDQHYHSALLDFRNDLDEDGRLSNRPQLSTDLPTGSLAIHTSIAPGQSRHVTFLLCWHFPNRKDWTPGKHDRIVGNWYSSRFSDAWEVATKNAPRMTDLEQQTVNFVSAFCKSDLPLVIKEAMLFNVSTLFSETCQRLPDGSFCAFEGCGDQQGYCEGSCTHVWNYEQTLPFLFGGLSQSMRDIEYGIATGERGDMCFRVYQPFAELGRDFGRVAADGQMGCIMKVYRDWQLSGDTERLRRLWPAIRRSLEYCWIPQGWDADQDGVMEGCQHNTMDVEYYGPNPQMQTWYLGALLAAANMAEALEQLDFAGHCRQLFARGSAWTDEHLFNGEYYQQQFLPPQQPELIPAEQRLFSDKAVDASHQLMDACLVDQLVGQTMADVCGLGDLMSREKQAATLKSIARFNTQNGFGQHFNVMRSFALGDESALLMASFPHQARPEFPFPYFSEAMSGFEYTAAAGMIYANQREAGLQVICNIRDRYDGHKRNPFNEVECGHHYARAMASWACGLAWTGFHYSAINKTMRVNGEPGLWFWSNGYAWGSYCIKGMEVELVISSGQLGLFEFSATGLGSRRFNREQNPLQPGSLCFELAHS